MTHTTNRLLWMPTCLTGLALVILATEAAAQQTQEFAVAAGARVYGDVCGRCHNPRSPLERDDRDWVTIANHMRVRGNLTGGQVRGVLAFLQATNSDPGRQVPLTQAAPAVAAPALREGEISTDPGTIGAGRNLVQQRACLGCHVIENAGGQVGPTLNGTVGRRGAQYLRQKLADPTFDKATSMMPNFGLTAEEIEAILAYLNTLNGSQP
jgi:mono/diheme cytochrome c family protein